MQRGLFIFLLTSTIYFAIILLHEDIDQIAMKDHQQTNSRKRETTHFIVFDRMSLFSFSNFPKTDAIADARVGSSLYYYLKMREIDLTA